MRPRQSCAQLCSGGGAQDTACLAWAADGASLPSATALLRCFRKHPAASFSTAAQLQGQRRLPQLYLRCRDPHMHRQRPWGMQGELRCARSSLPLVPLLVLTIHSGHTKRSLDIYNPGCCAARKETLPGRRRLQFHLRLPHGDANLRGAKVQGGTAGARRSKRCFHAGAAPKEMQEYCFNTRPHFSISCRLRVRRTRPVMAAVLAPPTPTSAEAVYAKSCAGPHATTAVRAQ